MLAVADKSVVARDHAWPPVGTTLGRLVTVGRPFYVASPERRLMYVVCACTCGGRSVVFVSSLKQGGTQSCGCLRLERLRAKVTTHGASKSHLYGVWAAMKDRCLNADSPHYRYYGGRGITVCKEWRDSFESFSQQMVALGWSRGLTVDRINNDGPYSPDNVRVVPQSEQAKNTRRTHRITAFGETKCLSEWRRDPRCSLASISSIVWRLRTGWVPEAAIATPPRTARKVVI